MKDIRNFLLRLLIWYLQLFILSEIMVLMEAKFFRFLKVVGIGFKARAETEGRLLYLKLGYSHEVELTVPPAVKSFLLQTKHNLLHWSGCG